MRLDRPARLGWVIAAGITWLLVLFVITVYRGLSEAVDVSTILGSFITLLTLLATWYFQRGGEAEPARPGASSESDNSLTLTVISPVTLLMTACALLIMPLCVVASDSLLGYMTPWPWWIAAGAAFAGISVGAFSIRENAISGLSLLLNMVWLLTYSLIILWYRQPSTRIDLTYLKVTCWVGAAFNLAFLLALLVRRAGDLPRFLLALRILFVAYMMVGMVLTAIALGGKSLIPWELGGWVFIAALIIDFAILVSSFRKVPWDARLVT